MKYVEFSLTLDDGETASTKRLRYYDDPGARYQQQGCLASLIEGHCDGAFEAVEFFAEAIVRLYLHSITHGDDIEMKFRDAVTEYLSKKRS